MFNYLALFFSFILIISCQPQKEKSEVNDSIVKTNTKFDSYWQDGKAEVSVYALFQNRYNAIHPGKVVSIFVQEDFLTDKQVKNESYESKSSTPILKNILRTNFTTGIYDYSLHTSVFTPINQGRFSTLKVTNTIQEWCGTTFLQMNHKNGVYFIEQRSYFEKEGDRRVELEQAVVEDALMNQIRLNYKSLPVGEFKFISKLSYMALKHQPLKVFSAIGVLNDYKETAFNGENLLEYRYTIAEQKREVTLVFESVSPFKIVGFTESYPSAFDEEVRTTIATLISYKRLAYWGMNAPKDAEIRKKIGL
tara:strand:- start:1979 stop:2899 length:921 start_codon:yes stop_codon:yes gene_type:complete